MWFTVGSGNDSPPSPLEVYVLSHLCAILQATQHLSTTTGVCSQIKAAVTDCVCQINTITSVFLNRNQQDLFSCSFCSTPVSQMITVCRCCLVPIDYCHLTGIPLMLDPSNKSK
jgi:hypothetical protein